MFGLEKHTGFIKSLVTEKAGQFTEMVTKNLSKTGDMIGMAAGSLKSAEKALRQTPDMILPEDAGSLGEQILGEVGEFSPEAPIKAVPDQIHEGASRTASVAGETQQNIADLAKPVRQGEIFPTREIMRKKLNHFQIERLAEEIKERLEAEIKVEKERRGEEP
jgi:hypothetical protein